MFYNKFIHYTGLLALTFASPSLCAWPGSENFQPRALYTLGNDPSGSFVVAAQISNIDGQLSNATKISTGGKGLDHLFAVSQDSIVASGNVRTLPS